MMEILFIKDWRQDNAGAYGNLKAIEKISSNQQRYKKTIDKF